MSIRIQGTTVIDDSRNAVNLNSVGVGTTAPASKLDIRQIPSGIEPVLTLDSHTTTDGSGLSIDFRASTNKAANRYVARIAGVREATGALTSLRFYNENGSGVIEGMRITSSGNVGIGTTAPNARLHVSGGSVTIQQNASSTGISEATFLNVFRTARILSSYTNPASITETYLAFHTNHSGAANNTVAETMRLAGANVGIGTTSPNAKLHSEGKSLSRTTDSAWGQSAVANPNDAEAAFVWAAGGTGYPGITSTYTRQWIAGLGPFSTGTDRWSLTNKTIGANTAITVLEGGDVGIGTISPSERLHVVGTGLASSDFRAPIFYDSNNTAYFADPASTSRFNQTRFQNRISVGDGNGTPFLNVGSPGIWLSYNGGSTIFMGAESTTTWGAYVANDWRFRVNSSGTASATGDMRAPIFYDSNNTAFYVDPASTSNLAGLTVTTRVNVHQSGAGGGQNVFAGLEGPTTANGRAQVVLSSAYSDLIIASSQANNNHGSTLTFAAYNPSNAADYRKFVINQGNWGSRIGFLDFGYSSAGGRTNPHSNINATDTAVTIDGVNKRLGIGTTTPSERLHVVGKGKFTGAGITGTPFWNNNSLEIQSSSGQGVALEFHRAGFTSSTIASMSGELSFYTDSGVERVRIVNSSGNVGINTTTPSERLHVVGNILASGTIQAGSDRRFKTNIETIDNAIHKITQLRGVYYTRTDTDDNSRHTGVIAQEVLPVLPEVVLGSEEDHYAVAYGNMVGLLIEAIKEQQHTIQQQQQEISKLTAQCAETARIVEELRRDH